jgi:hypothetical protein
MTLYIAECGTGVTQPSLHSSHSTGTFPFAHTVCQSQSLFFIQGNPRPSMVSTLPLLAVALSHVAQAWPTNYDAPQTPISAQGHTQGYEFDPLLHLPGISPYEYQHAIRSLSGANTSFQVLRRRRLWPKPRSTTQLQGHRRILPRAPCLDLR